MKKSKLEKLLEDDEFSSRSDVNGSYTGRDLEDPYAKPVQDADDL